jgi:hypothetical protein
MVATSLEKLDPSTSRSAPALEPSEGEQDERYDERTDRVLHDDVSGARLEPREKRGKATRWNEPVHGGDGKEEDAKKSGDQRRGRFIGRMYARTANFPLRRRRKIRHGPGREALPTFGLVNSRPGTFRAAPSQSAANEMRACCAIQRSSRMPGLSLGVPTNSMPPASKAALMSKSVFVRL